MLERRHIDVEELMERLRDNLRRGPAATHGTVPEDHDERHSQTTADLDYLASGYDVRQIALVSHRRVFGTAVVGLKRAIRQLLTPILDRQVACNAALVRVIADTRDWIATLERRRGDAAERVDAQINRVLRTADGHHDQLTSLEVAVSRLGLEAARVDARVAGMQAQVDGVAARVRGIENLFGQMREDMARHAGTLSELERQLRDILDGVRADVERQLGSVRDDFDQRLGAHARSEDEARKRGRALQERVSAAERRLRRLLAAGIAGTPLLPPSALSRGDDTGRPGPAVEFDYAGFTERFRGTEEEVRERQRAYLDCFENKQPVVDLGCGRGEFLQLMREAGLGARGVDVDVDMVLLCQDRGFDVTLSDAEAFLEALPDDSVGGIFAAQIIEHMAPDRVIGLVRLCQRKLLPGGVLVMETPNPACLSVFADSFYKDPSHVRPLHSDMMQFLFEAAGFEEVELRFSGPVSAEAWVPPLEAPAANCEQFNEGLARLNRLLYGFQDYAVIGRVWKPVRA
jgi:O-antigen chain-terminating methyltransferase